MYSKTAVVLTFSATWHEIYRLWKQNWILPTFITDVFWKWRDERDMGRRDSWSTYSTLQRHNTENSKQIFPEKELRGLCPNFQFMCLWAIYYSYDRSAYSAAGKYVDQSWEYINISQIHEYGNWDWGRAIPWLDFFGPQMAIASRLDAISQGQKRSRFPGPKKVSISRAQPPPTCSCNGDACIKSITYGPV